MGETEIAAGLEDATYHCEQHNENLNFVGKYALSRVSREHGYKVVLTGEGADEQFAGYPVFVPDFLKERDHAWPALAIPENERERLLEKQKEGITAYLRGQGVTNYSTGLPPVVAHELNNIVSPTTQTGIQLPPEMWADWIVGQWGSIPNSVQTIVNNMPARVKQKVQRKWHPMHTGLYGWTKCILANSILSCLGDRTEMAHSIEARTPFLDHELTEYANSLPPSVKLRYDAATGTFTEKWILREATRPFINKELYERKKFMYMAPSLYPENGPLHQLYKKLLTKENIEGLGFLKWEEVKELPERAFVKKEFKAVRSLNYCCQWIILGKRFGVARAEPVISV